MSRGVKRHGQSIYNKKININNHFVSISAGMSTSTDWIWVGGDDQSEEGKFKWVNGNPVQGIPWGTGQPDNGDGIEDCIEMFKPYGKFYDVYCDRIFSFLCALN